MHKLLLAGIVLVLVLAGVYFAFPGEKDDAFVVRSGDGIVELHIPKDAVLEGGAVADITITPLESGELADGAKAYAFKPGGLTFSKPATVSVTSPYDPGKGYAPVFFTFSGVEGELDILNVTDFRLDEAEKTVVVSAAMPHFSDMVYVDRYLFDAKYAPENTITAAVGQSFEITHTIVPRKLEQLSRIIRDITTGEARYQVTTRAMENEYPAKEQNYTIVTTEVRGGTKWKIEGDWNTLYTNGVAEPGKVVLQAAELGATETYRVTTRYTCAKAGFDQVFLRGQPQYEPQPTITHVKGGKAEEPIAVYGGGVRGGLVELRGPQINCVAPSANETSAQSGNGAATVPSAVSPSPTVPKSGGIIKVCGLPGGEPCPKR